MNTNIDISSLNAETKAKLDHYTKLSKELVEGIPVDITIRLKEKPVFIWEDGDSGSVTPDSNYEGYFKYYLDWDDLAEQEDAANKKYNDLIKEICDFADSVADSLNVDRSEFFHSFFM